MALKRIQQRREKRKKIFMGAFLSVLMVASGFGIVLSGLQGYTNAISDKDLSFNIEDNQYVTKLDGEERSFYYLPSSVEYIANEHTHLKTFMQDAQLLIITFDPNADPLNLQLMDLIRFDLMQTIPNPPIVQAVTTPSQTYNLPVVSCENATIQSPIIQIIEGAQASIQTNNFCMQISGNQTGLLQARDYLLYNYYDVYGDS